MELTKEWTRLLNELVSSPEAHVVVVIGAKNVGKSTFAHELFRRLLAKSTDPSRIGFLETDLGRPRFGFPGSVALHDGNRKQVGTVFLGEDEPSQRPETYLYAVERVASLIHRFDRIVVNTNGWIAGLGQEVLEGVVFKTQATHVVEIIPEQKASLGTLLRTSDKFVAYSIQPAKEERFREPRSKIHENMASQVVNDQTGGKLFAVGFNRVALVFPSAVIDRALPYEFALLAANTSLVGMCAGNPMDPETFLGIGIIYSIDISRKLMFVLSSCEANLVAKCTHMVIASSLRVPLCYFTRDSLFGDKVEIGLCTTDRNDPYHSFLPKAGYGQQEPRRNEIKRRRQEE